MSLHGQRTAIRELFQRNQDIDLDQFPGIVTAYFQKEYLSSDIPNLGLGNPPDSFEDGSLVQFDAMIQDTSFSSEIYLAKTLNGDCGGGWGLNLTSLPSDDIQNTNLRECKVFWAVSIPGLSGAGEFTSDYRSPLPHKYPIQGAPHVGVKLKVYDEALSDPLRATDISCFVGLLSSEPFQISDVSEPRNVPTLHVLFTKPLINAKYFLERPILSSIKPLRGELLRWIADEALGGDIIAAEWVLLTTLARVQSRNPSIVPLTLTLAGFPQPPDGPRSTPALHHVLSLVFPFVTTLPLSLDVLNNTLSCPESKEDDLHGGWLQLPRGSILILTESLVAEGNINNRGVMTIQAVQEMMRQQSVEYKFPFSSYTFETDVNFIVLANGKKGTFFKTNLNIPLRLNNSEGRSLYKAATDITLPPTNKLARFRQLVGGAKVGIVNVAKTTATGKHVEEDFVKERSANHNPSFTTEDLIQRIQVSRMLSLSLHEPEVSIDTWELAKDLERRTRAGQ